MTGQHVNRSAASPIKRPPGNQAKLKTGAHDVEQDFSILGEAVGIFEEEARQVNAVAAPAGQAGVGSGDRHVS